MCATITYVRWSSRMSRMSGISILRHIQLWYETPFVSYCFQLVKIVYIFGTASPILMRISANQSSLNAFTNKLQNSNLIVPDIRLISLDCITYLNRDPPDQFIRYRTCWVSLLKLPLPQKIPVFYHHHHSYCTIDF